METLQSSVGIQQGDPLGPLLFCLAIHDIVQEVHSAFLVFYRDDGTLGGSVQEVLHDLSFVERAPSDLGLHLNHDKLICGDTATRDAMLSVAPNLRSVDSRDATLLGSPIGSANGVDSAIRVKKEALEVLGGRLQHLYAHDALCLLQHVLSLTKMLYTLRTSPCFLSPELELSDQMHRKLLGFIANIDLFVNDRAWAQASLPVWSGGLGILSVAQLVPSAYLASAGSSNLSRQLLPPVERCYLP